jgi:hypothetical protein
MRTNNLVRHAIIVSTIALVAVARAGAMDVVTIPPSNEAATMTDYENLQTALSDAAPGTVIQLEAGTYYVNYPIAVDNFRGILRGAGKDQTIITTTLVLPAWNNGDSPPWLNAPSADNPWPGLLAFVDGNFTLSDMTFQITAPVPCSFFGFDALAAIVFVLGGDADGSMGSTIKRVGFEGAFFEDSETSFAGYNIIQGIYHEGLIGEAGGAWGFPLRGVHRVSSCSFETMYVGNSIYNLAEDASLTVTRNTISDVTEGLELYDTSGRIVFSHNDVSVHQSAWGDDGAGVLFLQGAFAVWDELPPLPPASLTVGRNEINAGDTLGGLDIEDWQYAFLDAPPSVDLFAWGNQITCDGAWSGIYTYALNDLRAIVNSIQGSVLYEGIGLYLTAEGLFLLNDVQDVEAGIAPFLLAADTYDNLVIAVNAWEDVLDETDDPNTPEYDGANTIIEVGSVGFGNAD